MIKILDLKIEKSLTRYPDGREEYILESGVGATVHLSYMEAQGDKQIPFEGLQKQIYHKLYGDLRSEILDKMNDLIYDPSLDWHAHDVLNKLRQDLMAIMEQPLKK